jgi:hypothetical protein
MAKYVNGTGTQINQKHVDLYKPPGSQTNIVCLSVYPVIILVICHLSVWGKVTLTKNGSINANGNITSLIAYNGLT